MHFVFRKNIRLPFDARSDRQKRKAKKLSLMSWKELEQEKLEKEKLEKETLEKEKLIRYNIFKY